MIGPSQSATIQEPSFRSLRQRKGNDGRTCAEICVGEQLRSQSAGKRLLEPGGGRDELAPIPRVGDRRAAMPRASLVGPQLLAGARVQREKLALGSSGEH